MKQILTFKDYLPLVQTLIGGVLTFLGGLLGSFLIQKQQRRAEQKSLASAFYGEIKALVGIIEKRQYIQGIKTSIHHLKSGRKSPFQVRVTRKYFNVYEKNLDKIGILPNPLPEEIVDLYTVMTAILEDLDTINEPEFYKQGNEIAIQYLTELQSLFEYSVESCHKICKKIKDMKLLTI
jgi:hypothetical protein